MKVFFYGLFMDENLLSEKGIEISGGAIGFADGFTLRIGERATLQRSAGSRAYGVVMEVGENDVAILYSEESVADYEAEPVLVELTSGDRVAAVCYNLPADKVAGTNRAYAGSLLQVAIRLGFPESYLDEIRRFAI